MKKNHLSLGILVLLVMLAQCLYFAWDTSQTIDETFYNGSGYAMVRYNDYERLGEHPPLVMQLGSLPLLFLKPNYPYEDAVYLDNLRKADGVDLSETGSKFLYKKGNNPQLILFVERIPVILITMLGGFFVFKWGYELFGFPSAIVSLVLYAFCSNMIANGSLFTTDMAVAVFFFTCLYFTSKIFISSPIRNGIYAGIFAGLCLLSKMSGLILIPTVLSLFCIAPIISPELRNKTFKNVEPLNKIIGLLSPILFLCAATQKITGIVLGSLCLAGTELTALQNVTRNKKIAILIHSLCVVGWSLLIVFIFRMMLKRPWPMVGGATLWCLTIFILSRFLSNPKIGEGTGSLASLFLLISFVCAAVIVADFTDNFTSVGRFNFFRHYVRSFNIAFGHILTNHKNCLPESFVTCDWRYFIALLSIKTPLTALLLSTLGCLALLKSKVSTLTKVHLVLPPLLFLLVASFFNRINLGVRHVLPIYPFMFLIAGIPVSCLKQLKNKVSRNVGYFGVSILALWVIFQNLSIAPHHLTYFNEFVRTPENGAKLVAEPSSNYGQDNRRLTEFVKKLRISRIKIGGIATNPAEYDYHGISWEPVVDQDFVNPPSGYYALDSTTYHQLQNRKGSWFRNKEPLANVGKTYYVFKV